jgi:hypothetical protein
VISTFDPVCIGILRSSLRALMVAMSFSQEIEKTTMVADKRRVLARMLPPLLQGRIAIIDPTG